MKGKTLFTAMCVVMFTAACSHQASAQAAPGVYADAIHPAGPPDPTKLDSIWQVDPLTGSVSITIPFTTTPAGGRGPKIPFTLHYNSASTVTLQANGVSGVSLSMLLENMVGAGVVVSNSSNWVQQYTWATVPVGSTLPVGPVGPWTTSGPYIYTTVSNIPNQVFTVQTGDSSVTLNEGEGCTISGPYIYGDENGAAHDMNLEESSGVTGNMSVPCINAWSEATSLSPSGNTAIGISQTSDGSALQTTSAGMGIPIGDTALNGTGPVVLYPDGSQYYWGSGILEDSNGNQATLGSSGGGYTATDSLGRAAFSTTIPIGLSGQISAGSYNVTTTGESGNSESYSVVFSPILIGSFTMPHPNPFNGEIQQFGYCIGVWTCPSGFSVYGPTAGATLPAVTSITRPDGTGYTFQYDPTYGTISSITFPTGGYVRFVWGIRGDGGGHGPFTLLSTLAVTQVCTSTGSGSENCWGYNFPSYSFTSGLTSTVTNPDGSFTAYAGAALTYTDVPQYAMGAAPSWKEASRLEYSSSGALMKSVATSYVNICCNNPQSAANGLPVQVATTLYDGPTHLQQLVDYTYDSYANLTEKDESDFNACTAPCTPPVYSAPPSGWLRKTFTSYAYATSNPAFVTAHIVNKPYQVLVTNGNGIPASLTTYNYDQSGYLSSAPAGLSNYDYANFGSGSRPRGNLTTQSKCISGISASFANGSFTATCGSAWNTAYFYDGTGQLTQKVERANASFPPRTIYTWGEQNNGFLTKVQHPDGNMDSYTYWQPIGAMASHTDWNGNTTNYGYADPTSGSPDPLNRIRTVTLPQTTDGTTGNPGNGTTTYIYTDPIRACSH